MSFMLGFADELVKVAKKAKKDDVLGGMFSGVLKAPKPPKPGQKPVRVKTKVGKPKMPKIKPLTKKRTYVPGMSLKAVQNLERKQRMPAPKVQRIQFKNP